MYFKEEECIRSIMNNTMINYVQWQVHMNTWSHVHIQTVQKIQASVNTGCYINKYENYRFK